MRNKGFTLTELMVVLGIIGLISFSVSKFSFDVFFLNSVARGSLTVSQDARNLLRIMTREIRASAPSANGAYPLVTVASSSLSFFSDIDGTGQKYLVRYYLSSTTLMKDVVVPTGNPAVYTGTPQSSIVMSDVRNATSSIFTYFDNTYAGTSSPLSFPVSIQSVRLVRIDLTLDANGDRSPDKKTFTTQVSIRNLKDNL